MGSFAYSEQKDQRVVAESAELVIAPEAQFSSPNSIALTADAWSTVNLSDVVFNEFPEAAQKSIQQLVETVSETSRITQSETLPMLLDSFNTALGYTAQQSHLVTETLGDKLTETQLGQASIVPSIAGYLALAVVVIILGRKFIK